jgi:hypothetical protein
MDDELLAHGEAAVEHAADLGDVDFGRALELALLGDLHQARIHGGFDQAFDHERVAIGDLDALELDVRADGELAAAFLGDGAVAAAFRPPCWAVSDEGLTGVPERLVPAPTSGAGREFNESVSRSRLPKKGDCVANGELLKKGTIVRTHLRTAVLHCARGVTE